MDGDIVHMFGQLGILEPDVPGLRRADRRPDGGPHPVQIGDQLIWLQVVPQQGLVTHDDANHGPVRSTIDIDQAIDLGLVGRGIGPQPTSKGYVEAVAFRELGYLGQGRFDAVGPDRVRLVLQQREVLVDFHDGRVIVDGGIVIGSHRLERKPLNALRPGRLMGRAVQQCP